MAFSLAKNVFIDPYTHELFINSKINFMHIIKSSMYIKSQFRLKFYLRGQILSLRAIATIATKTRVVT